MGVFVAVPVAVDVLDGDGVWDGVDVGSGVFVGVLVFVVSGVFVDLLGTHSFEPTRITVELPIQFAH